MTDRILYESHSHTPLCRHAVGEPEEYASRALARGLKGLIVTCHNPMPNGFGAHVRMREDEFESYLSLVDRARRGWSGRVDVRLGLEADFYPGFEPWLSRQLRAANFDYVLGSVHPQLHEFRRDYADANPMVTQRNYFRLLAESAESGLFDCLAHPDLVKNETADHWRPDAIWDDILRALERIAATGVSMELNTSGVLKRIAEMNPFPEMLRAMQRLGVPVVLGADAHTPQRVADGYESALKLLAECGYQRIGYYLGRERQEVEIGDALASLTGDEAVAAS